LRDAPNGEDGDRQVNDAPEVPLIIAGIVLLLLGLLLGVGILYTIGIILIIVGAVLWVVGSTGRAVGGRKHYY
jgi:membrane-bound ClpP family serine protease